jgi:hypothetical protein
MSSFMQKEKTQREKVLERCAQAEEQIIIEPDHSHDAPEVNAPESDEPREITPETNGENVDAEIID